jgi:hypothetical protein
VGALQFAGEELQAEVAGFELLGQRGEVDAAAEPLVPMRVTATPDARSSRARATALSSLGRLAAQVEIFSEKIRVTPAALRESS